MQNEENIQKDLDFKLAPLTSKHSIETILTKSSTLDNEDLETFFYYYAINTHSIAYHLKMMARIYLKESAFMLLQKLE